MWMLLILSAAVALAQTPDTIFPNDTQDPVKSGGAELLEVVCPGKVRITEKKEMVCQVPCPSFTGFVGEDFDWHLTRIMRGHFLSPISEDAALDMVGCEAGAHNYGGTFLLSKKSGKWVVRWYKAGVPTGQCHKVLSPSKREMLVCINGGGIAGFNRTVIYMEDLRNPKGAARAEEAPPLFTATDNVITCGENFVDPSKPDSLIYQYIERVAFQTRPDGTIRGFSVFGKGGERKMTPKDVQECQDQLDLRKPHKEIDIFPLTKPYRVDFAFDGKTFRRVTK